MSKLDNPKNEQVMFLEKLKELMESNGFLQRQIGAELVIENAIKLKIESIENL